jgi:hypothetical protein
MRNIALRNSIKVLASKVFSSISRYLLSTDILRDSIILVPKNNIVNEVNALLLRLIPR